MARGLMNTAAADAIQERVTSMYAGHPFPAYTDKFRKAAEEMYLKMQLLGLRPGEYRGKSILDCGCGTGEFTCWYAAEGNDVTAVDLSAPSLEHAKAYAGQYGLDKRIDFQKQSVLELNFPDNSFDVVYSYGVLHHTPDPYGGFQQMVRVCKPGGVVIVSVYSLFSRYVHLLRRRVINALAGDDIEKRFRIGKRLFPLTARKLKLRAHDASDAILYDQFSIPHESLHTVGEILGWYDASGLEYLGAYGPLRVRDYLYAASLPQYERLERTFAGSVPARVASGVLKMASKLSGVVPDPERSFQRPSVVSRLLVQLGWFFLGLRFSCFSISGRKPATDGVLIVR